MLQPKSIKKNKIHIFKNFYFSDLIVSFLIFVISISLGWFVVPASVPYRDLISIGVIIVLFSLLAILLIFVPTWNMRIWQFLIYFLKYLLENKKYKFNSPSANTSKINIYKSIEKNGIIKLKKKNLLLKVIEFDGKNIWIQNQNERQIFLNSFVSILNILDFKISFVKTNKNFNYETNIESLNKQIEDLIQHKDVKNEDYNAFYNYLYKSWEEISSMNVFESYDQYFVVLYAEDEEKLLQNEEIIIDEFEKLFIYTQSLDQLKTLKFLQSFVGKSTEKELSEKDFENLDNLLKVKKAQFFFNKFKIDDEFYKISTISEYSLNLNIAWANSFFNCDSSWVIWHLNPIEESDYEKILNKADNNIKTSMSFNNTSIYRTKKDLQQVEALNETMHLVNSEGQKLFDSSLFFLTKKENWNQLKKELDAKLYKEIKLEKCKPNPLLFRQMDAFQNLQFGANEKLNENVQFVSRNISYSWPFSFEKNIDKNSFILGKNNQKAAILDIWKRDEKHTNSNCVFFGTSGQGKTSSIKKLILDSYIKQNASVLILDPQREYTSFSSFLNTSLIDLSSNNMSLNPLQISASLVDNQKNNNLFLINSQIQMFLQWIKILNGNLDEEKELILTMAIKNMYKKYGFYDSNINLLELKNHQFPIIDHLIREIRLLEFKNEQEEKIYFESKIKIQNWFITNFTNNGLYQKMFNNHTTIDFLNNFTIIDTKTFVENNSVEFVNASFFLIIFLIQNKINKNFINNKKFILVIDELHKFIDSNNLTTLNFIFQTTKTIRKFNGSIILSTQNINDFALSKDLINKTQAILKNMQYKFFLHLPGDDIKMINQIFNPLSNAENEETNLLNKFDSQFVLNAKRGQLLLLSSFNEKNFLRVNYNEYEKEVILN
ncbi:Mbov_0397 family ICE element conjugal transfer ATPase [Mycoplasma sp. 1654_15]|uniref:Mbov_0397 family ICE element conjugal transfer ATPase n=1 Tax=Mycoplasma sp. 1654_15 TaxID=2725994 RepID=UPI00144A0A67|nr:DUF87 domain-containing protein [Mycoplasma sp. 1654_15]QJB71123.1 DUF87 domain-containing protein [Mycoplasma sp. 1654_15]